MIDKYNSPALPPASLSFRKCPDHCVFQFVCHFYLSFALRLVCEQAVVRVLPQFFDRALQPRHA